MRTISSRKLVTALAPPLNSGLPFEDTALSAGKMPALTKGGVRIDHAGWNDIARERLTLHDSRAGRILARTVGEENGWGHLCRRWHKDRRGKRAEIPAVSSGARNRLVGRAALNQRAPLHIVEEERPFLVRVIKVAESYRTADVEAVNVETEFLIRHEIILCIEKVVAIEFPSGSVELARSRLQDHGHGAGRRKTVIGTVVGSKRSKLLDRVRGGGDAHAARAAAVIVFATIEQRDVVILAHAVEFDT